MEQNINEYPSLDIRLEDKHLIVLNKPAGIGSQPDKTEDVSLLALAEAHCRCTLHPIHRIDRPATGLVVFAKTPTAAASLSRQFQERTVEKTYWAVVPPPPAPEGTLVHFLKKNTKTNKSTVFETEQPGTERAELHYREIGKSQRYCLLEITLITGRHHQIRAQLAAMGCPIKGDVKYGARRSNPDRSIFLHAVRLAFEHPLLGSRVELEVMPSFYGIFDSSFSH